MNNIVFQLLVVAVVLASLVAFSVTAWWWFDVGQHFLGILSLLTAIAALFVFLALIYLWFLSRAKNVAKPKGSGTRSSE